MPDLVVCQRCPEPLLAEQLLEHLRLLHPDKDGEFMGCGAVTTWGEGVEGGDIAAPSGDCYPRGGYSPREDMAHIALHDPADAIKRYEYALKILERHSPDADGDCSSCAAWGEDEDPDGQRYRYPAATSSPCFDVLDLAESLGIDTGGQS